MPESLKLLALAQVLAAVELVPRRPVPPLLGLDLYRPIPDGSLRGLEDVVAFCDGGGRPNPALDPKIRLLHLSRRDKEALVAFLRALTGEIHEGRSYNP